MKFRSLSISLIVSIAVILIFPKAYSSIVFSETFEEDVFTNGRWIKSQSSKYIGQPVQIIPSLSSPASFSHDKGLQLTQEMKHYGFGALLNQPVNLANSNELIIQYDLKLEETLNCGGAYIKLLREPNLENMDSNTPYSIMFGPDKCGSTNKIHFIFQHRNPTTNAWEEKHFNETIPMKSDRFTHLYTLKIRNDNNFDILVDNKVVKSGNLLTHMNPPVNPPEFIDDMTDIKPLDWVDDEMISDTSVSKPDDWDESQPKKIPDANAIKPSGWLDLVPLSIPDPDAKKPEDWDEEEDGTWEAPTISNPACEAVGCGPWSPPMVTNPLYKGKWIAPKITNPLYKGPWRPRQIANPGYFTDFSPATSMAPIVALAVEVWTINGGIHFDNFFIATSSEAVHEFTKKTFYPKASAEHAEDKNSKNERLAKLWDDAFKSGNLQDKARAIAAVASNILKDSPLAVACTIFAVLIPFLYLIIFGGKNAKAPESSSSSTSESNATEMKKEDSAIVEK